MIVKPATVIRWHRKGFRLYWRAISKRGPGRPLIPEEVKMLIRRLASENNWRARKIHAELGKLGFTVSLPTVSRYLPKRAVWFINDHSRRRIVHFDVTANPTAPWVIQQLRESFPYASARKYLIYDNDSIFSDQVAGTIKSFGIKPKRTAFRSPWQNGVAERWVGSCKREVIDHVVVFSEDHLRRLLHEYVNSYNAERVHTRIQDAPEGRSIETRPSSDAKVVGLPRVGGLHHRYTWREAA